ncbi:MAG: hypothetical protein H0W18_09330 [Acidobacteria bacterium]|nr:hypothetical protein [Acidobacteriota bacterium]
MTTSKTVSDASYWRCIRCGEVWNVARQDRNRRSYRRPFMSGG